MSLEKDLFCFGCCYYISEREDAIHFGPGDYYVNARDAIHSVWVDKPAIICRCLVRDPGVAHMVVFCQETAEVCSEAITQGDVWDAQNRA